MYKKLLIVPVTALAIGGAILFTPQSAHAQTTSTDPFTSLIQKIAQKFNLKEEDVKTVFESHREERQKEMQQKYLDYLTQAVKDGKITEAQKQLLISKHDEIKDKREENRENRQAEITALNKWATDNKVDIKYLMPFGKGHGMGMRKPF